MRLRGIDFGPCLDAPGIRGFDGEGYWYHRHLRRYLRKYFNFEGSTRVEKTVTIPSRMGPLYKESGNMPLGDEWPYEPVEKFPRSIWMNLWTGATLNAISLANPGLQKLCRDGFVRHSTEPYMLSFMAVGRTPTERLAECKAAVRLLGFYIHPAMRRHIGLQINMTCPNTGHDTAESVREASAMLDIFATLDIPLVVKINLLTSVGDAKAIAAHPSCDALCFTNAIPFGEMRWAFDWSELFPNGSPLGRRDSRFGGGGFSCKELLPHVAFYARLLRQAGVEKPFNAGGGIRCADDVDFLVDFGGLVRGHDSIFFASAAMVRPWNVAPIIARAHARLG